MHPTTDRPKDPDICNRYLRIAAWLVKYLSCVVPNWQWTYGSFASPDIGALFDAAETFDSAFELDYPIPRLANVIAKNAMRDLHDMSRLVSDVCKHRRIGEFFTPGPAANGPFDFPLFLRVYESEILPVATPDLRAMNCEEPAFLLRPREWPREIGAFGFVPFVSSECPVYPPLKVGEQIIYLDVQNHAYPGKIPSMNGPETYDIEITSVRPPSIELLIGEDPQFWKPIQQTFSALPRGKGAFSIMFRVTDCVRIDQMAFGLEISQRCFTAKNQSVRVTRLGLARSVPAGVDGSAWEIFLVTAAAVNSIQTYCLKYPQIVDAISTRKDLTILGLFGSRSRADEIQRELFDLRLKVQTYERPFVEETLASDTIWRIEDRLKAPVLPRTARRRNVPRREMRTAMERVTECVMEWEEALRLSAGWTGIWICRLCRWLVRGDEGCCFCAKCGVRHIFAFCLLGEMLRT
jgi:hypothetical protein